MRVWSIEEIVKPGDGKNEDADNDFHIAYLGWRDEDGTPSCAQHYGALTLYAEEEGEIRAYAAQLCDFLNQLEQRRS